MQSRHLFAAAAILMVVPFVSPASAVTNYDESVWFMWDKMTVDVLISDSIHDPVIAQSIRDAITIWENGIAYWSPTFAANLHFRVFWPDSGAIPPLDFKPDIVFVPQGFMSIHPGGSPGGGELQPTCYSTAPMFVAYGSFIRVTTHEFGHCLGQNHVFTNGVEYKPSFDIMGDGDGPKCPSNLNVHVIERAFQWTSGTTAFSETSTSYAQAPSC